ncbi:MAG: DUF1801 domain-containing protein [Candidatus Kaistia colombiensis]|nr:MAG: DUF1801 domain-containing protein [Kaistia sp.]
MTDPNLPSTAFSSEAGDGSREENANKQEVGAETGNDSSRIDAKLAALGDWRGEALSRMRGLIHAAAPEVVEAVKWVKPSNPSGVPTWEHAGILCTGEVYKAYVKLTFAYGAALDDPTGLFNAGFGGGTRRAIDIREGETIDAAALMALVKAAMALNVAKQKPRRA